MELYIIKQHNKLMLISQSPLGDTRYFICLFCNVTIILEIQLQTQRGAEQVQWLPLLKTHKMHRDCQTSMYLRETTRTECM